MWGSRWSSCRLCLEENDADADISSYFLLSLGLPLGGLAVHSLPPRCLPSSVPKREGSRRNEPAPTSQGYHSPLKDTCPASAGDGNSEWGPCCSLNLQKHTDLAWNHAHQFISCMERMSMPSLFHLFSTVNSHFVPVLFLIAVSTEMERENCFYGNRWKVVNKIWVIVYF